MSGLLTPLLTHLSRYVEARGGEDFVHLLFERTPDGSYVACCDANALRTVRLRSHSPSLIVLDFQRQFANGEAPLPESLDPPFLERPANASANATPDVVFDALVAKIFCCGTAALDVPTLDANDAVRFGAEQEFSLGVRTRGASEPYEADLSLFSDESTLEIGATGATPDAALLALSEKAVDAYRARRAWIDERFRRAEEAIETWRRRS